MLKETPSESPHHIIFPYPELRAEFFGNLTAGVNVHLGR